MTPRTPTPTLIAALRVLARDIHSGDGVANAAIAEAADRLEEMISPSEPTKSQLHSACLSYRHDYGVMDEQARGSLRATALEWLRVWQREGAVAKDQS